MKITNRKGKNMQSVWGIGRKVSSRHELVLSMFPPYKTIQQGHGAQLIICSCFDTKGMHVPLNKLWEGKQKQVMVCFSLGVPFQNSFFFPILQQIFDTATHKLPYRANRNQDLH